MELLGVEIIDGILNEFLRPFGCTAEIGTDFCYCPDSHIINYALVESEASNAEFMATINKRDPDVVMDSFMWSILHELGHHLTIPKIPDWRYTRWHNLKKLCEEGKLPRAWYYAFEDERLATDWAVEYANDHIEELRELWGKLQLAIMQFYMLNEVEVD